MNEILELTKDDTSWLLKDATASKDPRECEIDFESAISIWHLSGRPEAEAKYIVETLERSPLSDDQKSAVKASIWPPRREESPRERNHRGNRDKRERQELEALAKAREALSGRIDQIRSGDDLSALLYLQKRMLQSDTASGSAWAQTNWQALIPEFGTKLAEAAREGFMACWNR